MSTVVDLKGKPVSEPLPAVTPLTVLKNLVAKVESGEVELEDVLVIGVVPCPDNAVAHHTWDNSLTVAKTVYILEAVKHDLFYMIQRAGRD